MIAAPRSSWTCQEGVHHLPLHDDVQRAGRLVGDDQLGSQADGDGDADALLHAAAQLVRKHVRHVAPQTDAVEQLGNPSVERP